MLEHIRMLQTLSRSLTAEAARYGFKQMYPLEWCWRGVWLIYDGGWTAKYLIEFAHGPTIEAALTNLANALKKGGYDRHAQEVMERVDMAERMEVER